MLPASPASKDFLDAAATLSRLSMAAYRAIVYETPGFVDFFFAATPIAEIAELNIGSRPASRRASRRIEDLRAIPWSFSWGQARITLPGWFGFGSAVEAFVKEAPERTHGLLIRMNDEWPFFRALLSNMDMVLAKADMGLAKRYSELVPDPDACQENVRHFGRGMAAHDQGARQNPRDDRAAGRQPGARRLDQASLSLYRAPQPPPG